MTEPLDNLDLLMPFKMVFERNTKGEWRDTVQMALYRRLPEGVVCRISATSHCSQSLNVYISAAATASTRLSFVYVRGMEANVKHPEVPVTAPRYVSISGGGSPGEQITIEVIPMLIN